MSQAEQCETGVYSIRNTVNGKVYIGSASRSFRGRWNLHISELRRGIHSNQFLQRSWNKYGEDAFLFSVVERCHPTVCIEREQVWIDSENATDQRVGYNLAPIAGSSRGRVYSAESRARMSAALMGHPTSPEHRAKISAGNAGKRRSAETRAKMSAARLGKKLSDETKAKISTANKGIKHTAESRANMSASRMGRIPSPETRAKIGAAHRGKTVSAESRAKISLAASAQWASAENRAKLSVIMTGKTISLEHRAKISAANRGKKRSAETRARMSAAAIEKYAKRRANFLLFGIPLSW